MNDLRFPRGHAEDVLETYVKACGQCAYEPDLRDSPNARAGRSTSYDPCRTKSPFRKTREVSGLLQTNRPDCSLPVHCERVFPVDAQAPLRCHLVSLQSPLTSQVFLQQASVRPAPCVSDTFKERPLGARRASSQHMLARRPTPEQRPFPRLPRRLQQPLLLPWPRASRHGGRRAKQSRSPQRG